MLGQNLLKGPDAQGLIATANMEPVVGACSTAALLAENFLEV